MNIIFFGSAQFAVPSLQALIRSGHKISCVVTQPDKQKGRGLSTASTPVKEIALNKDLRIYQPDRINSPESIKFLKEVNPDLFIVIAYGQILSSGILNIPRIFSINLHASLLPKYRGAAPINWAIINGDNQTGLSIIKMNESLDAGEIILQMKVNIEDSDTALTLEKKLTKQGAELLLECLDRIENRDFQLLPQDETNVSLAPKLKKSDGLIDWHKQASQIQNLIKGTINWPGAFTYYNGKLLKIHSASVIRLSGYPVIRQPGIVMQVSKEGIVIATGEADLLIEELQIEGKRKMNVEEFTLGHKICPGEILGKKDLQS